MYARVALSRYSYVFSYVQVMHACAMIGTVICFRQHHNFSVGTSFGMLCKYMQHCSNNINHQHSECICHGNTAACDCSLMSQIPSPKECSAC